MTSSKQWPSSLQWLRWPLSRQNGEMWKTLKIAKLRQGLSHKRITGKMEVTSSLERQSIRGPNLPSNCVLTAVKQHVSTIWLGDVFLQDLCKFMHIYPGSTTSCSNSFRLAWEHGENDIESTLACNSGTFIGPSIHAIDSLFTFLSKGYAWSSSKC